MDNSGVMMEKIQEARRISFKHPDTAYRMSKEVYEQSKADNLVREQAYALFAMAMACRSMTKLKDCYNYAYDSLKLFQYLSDSVGISSALNLLGVVYFYYAKYESALEYFLKALNHLKDHEDDITLSRIYNNLGEVYRETGNLNEAITSYENALNICEKHNFLTNKGAILSNLGQIYFERKDFDNSYRYYKESYNILIQSGNVDTMSDVESRIGKIHFVKNQFDLARDYYMNALNRLNGINNKFFAIDVLVNLAELEMHRNEELFLDYLDKAMKYGEEINARNKLCNIYKIKTNFYEKKQDFELALEYYKRFHLIEQEIEATNVSQRLEIMKIELRKMFTGEELKKLKGINQQLESEIMTQKKLVNKMEKANKNLNAKVFTDELTGIYNRSGINNHLTMTWNNEAIGMTNVALLMIDIDHFKRYNDSMGHPEGDVCLKKVASCMKKTIGKSNAILGRYGGEEFVCFIKDTDYDSVMKLAQNIRKAIEKEDIKYGYDGLFYTVTISIGGVFGRHNDFISMKSLYEMADNELYKAKNEGRNRVSLKKATEFVSS